MTDLYERKAITNANAAILEMVEPLINEPSKRQYNKQRREINWQIKAILQSVAADSFVAWVEARRGVNNLIKHEETETQN